MDNEDIDIEDFSEMEELLNKTPKDAKIFVSHAMSIPEYVTIMLGDKPQNYIAEELDITEAQVSKWLSGASNMTLKTISKLEAALNINIINPEIIKKVKEKFNAHTASVIFMDSEKYSVKVDGPQQDKPRWTEMKYKIF
ncbi:MAG: helix-turn-helix transcriptional regulator [Ferruginibacter sp.]